MHIHFDKYCNLFGKIPSCKKATHIKTKEKSQYNLANTKLMMLWVKTHFRWITYVNSISVFHSGSGTYRSMFYFSLQLIWSLHWLNYVHLAAVYVRAFTRIAH
jgi:hypothetical protein